MSITQKASSFETVLLEEGESPEKDLQIRFAQRVLELYEQEGRVIDATELMVLYDQFIIDEITAELSELNYDELSVLAHSVYHTHDINEMAIRELENLSFRDLSFYSSILSFVLLKMKLCFSFNEEASGFVDEADLAISDPTDSEGFIVGAQLPLYRTHPVTGEYLHDEDPDTKYRYMNDERGLA